MMGENAINGPFSFMSGLNIDEHELTREIGSLIEEARKLKQQIEQLKSKFYTELEDLTRKYREIILLIAERVVRLSEIVGTSVENVVDVLVDRRILDRKERDEVLKVAKLFIPDKKKDASGKRARETAPATVKEMISGMVRQDINNEIKSLLKGQPPIRAFPNYQTKSKPVTFTCPLCNEEHEIPERVVVDMCYMCHSHLNYLVEQGVFKKHGAAFKRLLEQFLAKAEQFLVKAEAVRR